MNRKTGFLTLIMSSLLKHNFISKTVIFNYQITLCNIINIYVCITNRNILALN